MAVKTTVVKSVPKRGRMSLEEIEFIKNNTNNLTVSELALHLGRSEDAVAKHFVVAPTVEVKPVVQTDRPGAPKYPISENQIGKSGIGRNSKLPDNGNVSVMNDTASRKGDDAVKSAQEKREEYMQRMQHCVRPIKGFTDEQVIKHEEDLSKNIRGTRGEM